MKSEQAEIAVGKTIARIEFGEEETAESLHRAEALILHFTDGSSMAIQIGSNIIDLDLAWKLENLKPRDFATDLMVTWAPSVQKN